MHSQIALTVCLLSSQTSGASRARGRGGPRSHSSGAGLGPHALSRPGWAVPVPGSRPARGTPGVWDPRRDHTDRGAGTPAPVITFQCGQLSGPEGTPAPSTPSAAPRLGAARPAGPEPVAKAPAGSGEEPAMQTRPPPCAGPGPPRPYPQRPRARPPASVPTASRAARARRSTCLARAPTPPSAPRPAPPHLPRSPRPPPARTAAAAATRLPFSLALKKNHISCSARAPAPRRPPRLRSGSGASSPASSRAAPPLAPPAPPAAAQRPPPAPPAAARAPHDVTARSRAPASGLARAAPRSRRARLRALVLVAGPGRAPAPAPCPALLRSPFPVPRAPACGQRETRPEQPALALCQLALWAPTLPSSPRPPLPSPAPQTRSHPARLLSSPALLRAEASHLTQAWSSCLGNCFSDLRPFLAFLSTSSRYHVGWLPG